MRDFDKYDVEFLLKFYNKMDKRCELVDESINRLAMSFSFLNGDWGSGELYDEILDKINAKRDIFIVKEFIRDNVMKLQKIKNGCELTKVALLLMHYPHTSITEKASIVNKSERTLFRSIQLVYERLASLFNKSKYKENIIKILDSTEWFAINKENVKSYREAFYRGDEE